MAADTDGFHKTMIQPPRYYALNAYFPLLEMVTCAFNAVLFTLIGVYSIRDYQRQKTRWGGGLFTYVVVLCAVVFIAHLGNDFATEFLRRRVPLFDLLEIVPKYAIPPVMAHLFYRNEKEHLRAERFWRSYIGFLYAIGAGFAAAEVNAGVGHWLQGWPGWPVVRLQFRILMIFAAAGCGLTLLTARQRISTPLARMQRRRLTYACGIWMGTFLAGFFLPANWDNILGKLVPVCFIFVVTYYVERFAYFDVLMKRGVFVFASLLLLTFYFVAVPPLLSGLGMRTWVGTLVWALSVWPVVLLAPWGHRRLSLWVDRHFLRRRLSAAQATRLFMTGLQGAINEKELTSEAETHLRTIFGTRSEVRLGASIGLQPGSDGSIAAPIRLHGDIAGEIHVYRSGDHARFLSEDALLLASLADGLAFLLENLRLREKKLEHEKRERELVLNANRLELKALRAQINPHFLFNALNTIASLIPRHPDRAEETVEELAEVFRYTLRRSEREWVRLDEELEAVRAFLHVEQARFGERLRFLIDRHGETEGVRIPAMIVQTLVENAVKHGVAAMTAPGLIEVRVEASQSGVRIEVRDNGPGFTDALLRKPVRKGNGYGLHNVQGRLRGYFGHAAKLTIERDNARNMTLVSIALPSAGQPQGATPE
ncbi:MAG TPA: histidine kinase [Bryobacteraceae bacterium]|nr:histidine kinase [Bryobacteraceae bacterium]